MPGQSGLRSLAKILKGDINPSGKLIDTYAYDFKTNPSYVNALAMNNNQGLKQVVYEEGIYVGYRWYETAYSDGYLKIKNMIKSFNILSDMGYLTLILPGR